MGREDRHRARGRCTGGHGVARGPPDRLPGDVSPGRRVLLLVLTCVRWGATWAWLSQRGQSHRKRIARYGGLPLPRAAHRAAIRIAPTQAQLFRRNFLPWPPPAKSLRSRPRPCASPTPATAPPSKRAASRRTMKPRGLPLPAPSAHCFVRRPTVRGADLGSGCLVHDAAAAVPDDAAAPRIASPTAGAAAGTSRHAHAGTSTRPTTTA